MSKNIIGRISGYLISINGNCSKTLGAPSGGMGIVFRIGGQVPFKDDTAPVTGPPDDQGTNMPRQISGKISRSSHPLLRKIEIFIQKHDVYINAEINTSGNLKIKKIT